MNGRFWEDESLSDGLVGARLKHELQRMMDNSLKDELQQMAGNQYEYQVNKKISLRQLDPVALLQLTHNGECYVDIPEVMFDADFPGQYFRRLMTWENKQPHFAVRIVTTQAAMTSYTLTLLASSGRKDPALLDGIYTL
ncbi:hypothetical protein ABIE00_002884 [Arthrobacter sp. OAP107]